MNEYDPKDKFKISKPQGKVLIQENVRSYRSELGSALNLEEKVRWIIRIAGVSELKWIGMAEFNSDDHYIYYRGQESLRRKLPS